jgi:Uncharacterised nucleotidyltransferase
VQISEQDLEAIVPQLVGSGAGPLAWWRIRHSELRGTQAAQALHVDYIDKSVHAALGERDVVELVGLLRSADTEPILLKGWSIARLYPEPGLRPFGDIDVAMHPRVRPAARAALDSPTGRRLDPDLVHEELEPLTQRDWDGLYARSELVPLDGTPVRVLSPEDHLAFLCLHFLRHGAWRPLWLCDIAVALEQRTDRFSWNQCLAGDPRHADWIMCAIELARVLLGARVDGMPPADRSTRLPGWLIPAVLKQWETPTLVAHVPAPFMAQSLRQPAGIPLALRRRWPDPIQATMRTGGRVNNLPRLPFQIWAYVRLSSRFLLGRRIRR